LTAWAEFSKRLILVGSDAQHIECLFFGVPKREGRQWPQIVNDTIYAIDSIGKESSLAHKIIKKNVHSLAPLVRLMLASCFANHKA